MGPGESSGYPPDKELSGTCVSEQSSTAITGEVNGNKVKWQLKVQYNGDPLTLEYTGTVG